MISVAAPTDEEAAHHHLWRFWRQIPRDGYATLYDRSWYGRVLVERVEGFAAEADWRRAYAEINRFEEQLVEHGTVVAKFWLHISDEEQLRRFREREETPWKQHKITDEDWRNRERRDDYRRAVEEMVARTSTTEAPWTLVPAEDKKVARIRVLDTLIHALKQALADIDSQNPPVIINADAEATHQSVIRVMDVARQVGLRKVTFATRVLQSAE